MKPNPDGQTEPSRASSLKKKIPRADQPDPETISDRQWKIAQLAATLATRYAVPHGQSHIAKRTDPAWTLIANEADPRLDPFYISLLRRAEFLLIGAGARWGQLHAEELFDPADHYTVKEITREFQLAGWAGLESVNSVKKLLADVEEVYTKRADVQINHFVRSEIDDQYYNPSGRKSKGEAGVTEAEIIAILKDPKKALPHPKIGAPIKSQISSILTTKGSLLDLLGKGRYGSRIVPGGLFAICREEKILDEKLWRDRSALSRTFPF
jgi:hypothetical protein